jgi:hypothetical protein
VSSSFRAPEPTISISLHDADVELVPLANAPRRPSLARWIAARVLFVIILALVALVGAAELSVALHEPRLDPRPHVVRYARLFAESLRSLNR